MRVRVGGFGGSGKVPRRRRVVFRLLGPIGKRGVVVPKVLVGGDSLGKTRGFGAMTFGTSNVVLSLRERRASAVSDRPSARTRRGRSATRLPFDERVKTYEISCQRTCTFVQIVWLEATRAGD